MMNLNEFSEANSEFSDAVQMDRNHIAPKNILLAKSIYQLAIHMKGWEAMPKYVTDLMSNAKYGDTLHPYAS